MKTVNSDQYTDQMFNIEERRQEFNEFIRDLAEHEVEEYTYKDFLEFATGEQEQKFDDILEKLLNSYKNEDRLNLTSQLISCFEEIRDIVIEKTEDKAYQKYLKNNENY